MVQWEDGLPGNVEFPNPLGEAGATAARAAAFDRYKGTPLPELRDICHHRASLVGRLEQELAALQEPSGLEERVHALEEAVAVAESSSAKNPAERARRLEAFVEEISDNHSHHTSHMDHAVLLRDQPWQKYTPRLTEQQRREELELEKEMQACHVAGWEHNWQVGEWERHMEELHARQQEVVRNSPRHIERGVFLDLDGQTELMHRERRIAPPVTKEWLRQAGIVKGG